MNNTYVTNSKGMSLVAVMIAGALLSGLALGMAKLMQTSFEGQREIESKDDLRSMVQIISGNLANSDACVATFSFLSPATITQAQTSSGFAFTQVLDRDGAVLYDVNDSANNSLGKVTLTGFRLRNLDPASNSAELLIQAAYKKNAVMTLERDRVLGLSIAVDSGSNVSVCSSIGVDDGLWEKMTPPALGILYSAGSVMVGTGNVNTGSPVPAFAAGSNNTIVAGNAAALGANNQTNGDSNFSMLLGRDNRVMGTASTDAILIGSENLATRANAVAIGHQNDATGYRSLALGQYNIASNDNSVAMGTAVAVTGPGAVGIGVDITSSGTYSTALGYNATASGSSAMAFGYNTNATGSGSTAFTHGTASGANSVAFGGVASGSNSFTVRGAAEGSGALALGQNARALGDYSTAIGRFAKASNPKSTVLSSGSMIFPSGLNVGATDRLDLFFPAGNKLCRTSDCSSYIQMIVEAAGSPYPGNSIWGVGGNMNLFTPTGNLVLCKLTTGINFCGQRAEFNWASGSFDVTVTSDRNTKKEISLLAPHEVLDRFEKLNIYTWKYLDAAEEEKKSIGPMAQDFYALFVDHFDLKGTDTTLNSDHVFYMNVLATQALHDKVKYLEEENTNLKKEIETVKNEVGMLRQAVCELSPRSEVCQN